MANDATAIVVPTNQGRLHVIENLHPVSTMIDRPHDATLLCHPIVIEQSDFTTGRSGLAEAIVNPVALELTVAHQFSTNQILELRKVSGGLKLVA